MNNRFNSLIFSLSFILAATAQATPVVTYSPPLTVNTVEHFSIMDVSNDPDVLPVDITANYKIQSIAPDSTSGYTPAHSSTAIRSTQQGSFIITYVSSVDSSTFTDTASYTASPAYVQLIGGAGQSASTGSALSQPIKVQVSDSGGNAISGATVNWSITGSGGTFSPSTSNSSGIASTTLTMGSNPGTYSVTATAGSVSSSDLIQATANPATNQLSNLAITVQPSASAQQNIIFPTQPILSLTNGSGASYNIATQVSVTPFSNSSCTAPAGGLLGGTTTVTSTAAGSAAFTNLTYSANAAIFLKFTAGTLSVCSGQVSVAQPSTAATKLALNFTPTSAFAGSSFNLLVNVTDNGGNIIASASNSISLAAFTDSGCSTTPATGTLANATAINAYSGQALFNSLTYTNSETIYIKATASGLTPICSTGIQIKSNPVNVGTALAFVSGPTNEFAGQLFGVQPFVIIQNSLGTIVQNGTSAPITIAAYSNAGCTTPASGTMTGSTLLNSIYGVGAYTNLSYSASGKVYLGVSSPGLTSACSPAITMNSTPASQAAKLKFNTAPSTTAIINTFLTTQPVVEVDDSTGAVVPGVQGYMAINWYNDSACSSIVSGTSEADTRIVNGVATFSYLGMTTLGTYYLGASFNNLATLCSAPITVSPLCSGTQHYNSGTQACDNNVAACTIANGTGTKTWDGVSAYSACTLTSCNTNYYQSGNSCLAQVCSPNTTAACPITNGTGSKTCTALGDAYGSCSVVSCSSGYQNQSNSCVIKYDTVSIGVQGTYSGVGTLSIAGSDGTNLSSSPTIVNSNSFKDQASLTISATPFFGSAFNSISSNIFGFTSTAPFTYTLTGPDSITPSFVGLLNAPVQTMAMDSSGNLYVGGSFTQCGSLSVGHIAKIKANGTCDSTFDAGGTGLNSVPNTIVFNFTDNTLYAGGSFTSYNSIPNSANYLIHLDLNGNIIKLNAADTSTATGNGFNGSVNSLVFDSTGNMFVGGTFTTDYVGGSGTANNANYLAKLRKTTTTFSQMVVKISDTTGAFGNGFANGSIVKVVAIDLSGDLWVGGNFQESYIGGSGSFNNFNNIMKVSGSNGSPMKISPADTVGNTTNGVGNSVQAIAFDSIGNAYIGGQFQSSYIGGSGTIYNANYALKINSTGTVVPINAGDTVANNGNGFSSPINAIRVDASNNVYFGGLFFANYIGGSGSSFNTSYIAKLNSSGVVQKINPGDTTGNGKNGLPSTVYSIIGDGVGNTYVGTGSTSSNFGGTNMKTPYVVKFDVSGNIK